MTKERGVKGNEQNAAYIAARAEWDERWGTLVTREKAWKVAFFIEGIIVLCLVFSLMSVVKKSSVVPFVVAVNDLHQVVGAGFATESKLSDPLVVQAKLAQYIENARAVSSDGSVTRQRLQETFASTTARSPAYTYLRENWMTNSPFARAQKETVEVEVQRVLQISQNSYEVDWTETTRDARDGGVLRKEQWKGILGISILPLEKKADETLVKNPLGIFVNSITWSKNI
jgi:type IV secretion system protein VirB5